MTQQLQNEQNEHQQLPPIQKKESHNTQKDQQTSHQDMNNVLPLTHTHEKKKKKHRRKLKKHSPQHYEEIRIKKLNKKLQQKWDSHFINDQIPDLFEKKKINTKTLSKLGNNPTDKRSSTGLNSRMPPNKPADLEMKKQTLPLPKILKGYKRKMYSNEGSRSFNIHVVAPKQLESQGNKRKQNQSPFLDPKNFQKSNQKQKRLSQLEKQQTQQKTFSQEYRKTLTSLFEQKKFLNCHKEMLDLFIQKIGKKQVRQTLDKEFQLLKKNESTINRIMKAIQNRQKFMENLNLLIDKEDVNEKEMLEVVDNYRTSTLAVVEEILKWKEIWQKKYFEDFKKAIAFDLVYKAHNYLFTLASSADETIKKLHKQRQNQQQKERSKPQAQKVEEHKEATISQQIDTTKRQPQQNDPNTSEPKNEKTIDQSKIQQTLLSKGQSKESEQNILLNDPFLISLFDIGKEDKSIILKIRACELLLVQEQFNFFKK